MIVKLGRYVSSHSCFKNVNCGNVKKPSIKIYVTKSLSCQKLQYRPLNISFNSHRPIKKLVPNNLLWIKGVKIQEGYSLAQCFWSYELMPLHCQLFWNKRYYHQCAKTNSFLLLCGDYCVWQLMMLTVTWALSPSISLSVSWFVRDPHNNW